MTAAAPALVAPLAVDWIEALRVCAFGFAGVFVVLTLLYLSTLLYGALVHRFSGSRESMDGGS